jgi:N-formylglutamate amidohydrolase
VVAHLSAAFTIHRPVPAVAVPLVIHVPHASEVIPAHCRADFAMGDDDLRSVMAALIDHDTDRLALAAVPLGAHVFVNGVCRLVVDPERFPADADEPAAIHGLGSVSTTEGSRP